jgi:endonuclease G
MFDNQKVREALERVASDDDELGEELRAQLDRPVPEVALSPRVTEHVTVPLSRETIVLRTGRPVLAIQNNNVVLEFRDAESKVWKQRLTGAREQIRKPILAVGRIDLVGHPDYSWVGTGWLVRPDIIATNRHVAELFARRLGDALTFRLGTAQRPMSASIDFLREADNEEQLAFRIQDVLYIEDDDGPDVALLRVAGLVNARPIPLSVAEASARQQIAVIGYPARDSRIPDQDLMENLFGDVYDCKRLAPGQIKEVQEDALLHDCSTLGGNSGSVVLDLASGEALGIHFAGRFLEANFAVPSRLIEERVRLVERPGSRRPIKRPEAGKAGGPAVTVAQSQMQLGPESEGSRLECIIPLKVTLEVGPPMATGSQVADEDER